MNDKKIFLIQFYYGCRIESNFTLQSILNLWDEELIALCGMSQKNKILCVDCTSCINGTFEKF